jgi:multiple antibiotic resistance protein
MNEDFARAFVSFFAIIDPIGNVLVFYLLTQNLPQRQRLLVALAATTTAWTMLVLFVLAGHEVLDFLGISFDSFKTAAGLLLLLPAYRLVSEGQPMDITRARENDPLQIALVPLATPLIAGPGALAIAISFADTLGATTTILSSGAVLGLDVRCLRRAIPVAWAVCTATPLAIGWHPALRDCCRLSVGRPQGFFRRVMNA